MRLFVILVFILLCGATRSQVLALGTVPQVPAGSAAPVPHNEQRLDPPRGSMPFVHDPSTVIKCRGMYYVYTTGKGIPMLSSPDKVNWTRLGSVFTLIPEQVHAAVPKNNGTDVWAPDIIRVGNRFLLYYAVSSWGSFRSVVALATNTTLDPADPAYKWVDQGVVVGSDGTEDMNDIDPGVVRAPDGTMWLCYGSYHGSIKVLQLDPRSGKASADAVAVPVARQSEAADIITHGGYFYLFVNHGSCCQGKNSEYNIRVGRSRSVTGPYLDKHGIALTTGGGSLFLAAHDHRIGPGHFGRVIEDADSSAANGDLGAEQFSLHYEADLNNLGRPTLGIRPLLWSSDGWPMAGDGVAAGTYQLLSAATEDTLTSRTGKAGEAETLQLKHYLAGEDQQWSLEPAVGEFYKVMNVATRRALGASFSAQGSLGLDASRGDGDEKLWRLHQLTDGSYRVCSNSTDRCLTRGKEDSVVLTNFVNDDDHRWLLTSP